MMTNKKILFILSAFVALASTLNAQSWQSQIIYYGSNNKLVYVRDANNNVIGDFSYAGYKNGGVPIPTIAVVDSVSPVAGDNTTNIQNGINRVASRPLNAHGFRGALLMKAGRYRVSGTILLNASGVILQGVGDGSDSLTNTIIYATGDSITQPTVLIAGGGNGGSNSSAWSGSLTSNVNIVTDSVHVGDRTFQVANASLFSVGDNIIIYHPDTTPWKRAVDWGGVPNDTGTTSYWAGVTIPIKYNRYITAINGNSITIDAPVFATLVRSLSQSYIYKTDRSGILTNIGIENLRVDINNPYNQSPTNSNGDERHHSQDAIWLGKIEDAWVRHCTTLHFVQSGFKTSIATRVTIDSCKAIDPISIIDGSRRYNFNTYYASQLILFSNCYAIYSRHAYVSNGTSTVSGIVFYNCTSEKCYNASEGHRLWSQGLLYDNLREINTNVSSSNHVLGLYNRGDFGSGHGWASAHSVAWNCNVGTSNIIIQKPPTAQNYGIGCIGNVTGVKPPAPFSHPQGYIEGTNVSGLNPTSLYLAQLSERLSTTKVLALTSLIEGFYSGSTMVADTVTVELHNAASPYALVDQAKVLLSASGSTTANFLSAADGTNYYIVVKQRNSIETWSKTPQAFSGGTLNYDFTTATNKAYGDNMRLKGTKWCIYNGDVNQDGVIDLTDVSNVDLDNLSFSTGYRATDVNGDNLVDLTDLSLVDNNNLNFVTKVTP